MKVPAAQFYFGDWRKDPGVQSLSYHDRGVWFEILCLMNESSERGKLLLNGNPMPEEALARILGLSHEQITQTISTLISYGVASYDERGALICRRMVRDEEKLKQQREVGKLGGNPKFQKGKPNPYYSTQKNQVLESDETLSASPNHKPQDNPEDKPQDKGEITPHCKQNLTPSSSTSISTSSSTSVHSSFLGKKKRTKNKTDPPENFILTEELRAFAVSLGVADPESEAQACLDHFRGIGECRSDWNATLRNWMRKHVKWEKERKNGVLRTNFKTKPNIAERSAEAIEKLSRDWVGVDPRELHEGGEECCDLFS